MRTRALVPVAVAALAAFAVPAGHEVQVRPRSGLAAKAGLASVAGSARAVQLAEQEAAEQRQDTHSLLLLQNAVDEACAVPLDLVLRVERIVANQIETTVQAVHGTTMPQNTQSGMPRTNFNSSLARS